MWGLRSIQLSCLISDKLDSIINLENVLQNQGKMKWVWNFFKIMELECIEW